MEGNLPELTWKDNLLDCCSPRIDMKEITQNDEMDTEESIYYKSPMLNIPSSASSSSDESDDKFVSDSDSDNSENLFFDYHPFKIQSFDRKDQLLFAY